MTREARRIYRLNNLSVQEINFILGQMADRIDELEGRRGTPKFRSNVDMGANRITSVADASDNTDAIPLGQASEAAAGIASTAASAATARLTIPPVGTITMYGGSTAPSGWLLCDGASVLRLDYPDLYIVVGTTFGSIDSAHFTVPDFRGIFPKGAGTTDRTLGVDANGNFYAGTLGTYSQDKMQGHYHRWDVSNFTNNNWLYTVVGGGADYGVVRSAAAGGSQGHFDIITPYTDGTNGTPRTGMTTEPQSLGISFIIKY